MIIYLTFFTLIVKLAQACLNSSFCDTCDINNTCLTCPPTRQLIANSSICQCQSGYADVNQTQCQVCSNPYCYQCSANQTSQCTNCGNQSITHRQLNNSNCVCMQNYTNVPWSFNCQTIQYDTRIMRFKYHMEQPSLVGALETYVNNSQNLSSLIVNLQSSTTIAASNQTCSLPNQMDEASQTQICPHGEVYQDIATNIFGSAFLNNNTNASTSWYVDINNFGLTITERFIYQRNLTLTYNIIGFQIQQAGGAPLVLEILIVEVLNVSFSSQTPSRRMLTSTNATLPQPYMQYLFFVAYNRSTLLNDTEIQDVIDRLMAIINGCMDFCDQCSIFRNSIQCNSCQGNRQYIGGQCQCQQNSAQVDQCATLCQTGCQQCIQDCYNCQNVTNQDYSSQCPLQKPPANTINSNNQGTISTSSLSSNASPNPTQNPTSNPSPNPTANPTPNPISNSNPNSNPSNPTLNSTPNSTTNIASNTSANSSTNLNPNKTMNTTNTQQGKPFGTSTLNTTTNQTNNSTSNNSYVSNPNTKKNQSSNSSSSINTNPGPIISAISIPSTISSNSLTLSQISQSQIISPQSSNLINDSNSDNSAGTSTSSSSNSQFTLIQTNPDTNKLVPLYAVLGVSGLVLMSAPLIYYYLQSQQAAKYLIEKALDSQGIPWPHKKFSLPQGRDISTWEEPISNQFIENFQIHNRLYH